MKKYLVSICLGLIACLALTQCRLPSPKGISDIKSAEWQSYVGKELKLEGYYVSQPVPMLLMSMELININAPIPEDQYIRLVGDIIRDLDPKKYYGAYVKVEGIVQLPDSLTEEAKIMSKKIGGVYAVEFECASVPTIIRESDIGIIIPEVLDLCRIFPKICLELLPPQPDWYAILLSGGYNSANAHFRYWNDLKFMYHTLRSKYAFPDENIRIIYKDGLPEDNDMPVHFPATIPGVDSAFIYIRMNMGKGDNFFFFATNHGGGFLMEEVNARNRGGRLDASVDETDEAIFEEHLAADLNADGDQTDQVRYDEVIYLYNSKEDLWDDDLAGYISSLKNYDKMVIVLEPCFSGGNLADLRGRRRIIVSAASEYEYSWSGGPGNHDMFSYHFTAALNEATHTGTAVNSDANNDGKVSMVEAFEYARQNDTANETPWYEDSGDGRGHPGPLPQDGDGVFGAAVSLD